MSENLFRQKSIDHITSPEDMHNYMRVTSPRLWMLLSAISLLLIGFIVYASTTKIENKVPVRIYVNTVDEADIEEDTEEAYYVAYAQLPNEYSGRIEIGMPVRVREYTGTIEWITSMEETVMFSVDFGDQIEYLPVGEYDGEVILESTTPINFLWN